MRSKPAVVMPVANNELVVCNKNTKGNPILLLNSMSFKPGKSKERKSTLEPQVVTNGQQYIQQVWKEFGIIIIKVYAP